jgi:hypothetical protein
MLAGVDIGRACVHAGARQLAPLVGDALDAIPIIASLPVAMPGDGRAPSLRRVLVPMAMNPTSAQGLVQQVGPAL